MFAIVLSICYLLSYRKMNKSVFIKRLTGRAVSFTIIILKITMLAQFPRTIPEFKSLFRSASLLLRWSVYFLLREHSRISHVLIVYIIKITKSSRANWFFAGYSTSIMLSPVVKKNKCYRIQWRSFFIIIW